ncbi:MAG: hypothetical protein WCD42_02355 [Rhizomicrobium sp.]
MTKRWITDRKNRASHKYNAIHVQLMHEVAQKSRAAAQARKAVADGRQLALFVPPASVSASAPITGQNAGAK